MTDKNLDRNSRDQDAEESRDVNKPEERESAQTNPPMKGTDIPATTDLEYIDREKGKRTTM